MEKASARSGRIAAALLVSLAVVVFAVPAIAANSPFGVGLPEANAAPSGPFASFFAWIAAEQSAFYRSLQEAIKQLKEQGSAGWWLVGLSFAYGVFHAAGPGHGKAIISSYVLANEETVKRGIVLSFASALAQAVTAVLLIGIAAILLNMTSIAITETTRWFELGSYLAVMLIGVGLLWQKAFRPILAGPRPQALEHIPRNQNRISRQGYAQGVESGAISYHERDPAFVESALGAGAVPVEGHGHYGAGHHHHHAAEEACPSCGHSHAPDPGQLQGEMSLGKAWSVIVAVGLRPCTGALVVLVFALAQGLIWAGVLSTFAMALGTGITVAVLASLAVGAKGVALKLFGEGTGFLRIHRAIEITGAAFVFLLGATLFIAAAGWGAA
ncbi:nickel/cobalt transporter [Rhizobiales bacterium]|uniref:nickel/cobalt transporter n=1 Tax=Hongsoonwoonella zoysiae TaxID=2821844 RepID=UPI001561A2E4|nr:nickel/cobalt transporter [Hongsoonwoonella zoysiae]NRG17275.1 nickel/cobalt transporter [Hongsoonwoonella zoysiae]